MANLKLAAKYRSDMSKGHKNRIRRQGYVTGSIFSHDTEPVSVELSIKDLAEQIKASEAGIMSLIDVKIEGAPSNSDGTVILKEFHKDPLTRKVVDIQFQRISMKEKLHVSVPIELVGEAAGTKEGGVIEQILSELEVNCLPGDIPSRISVDIADLQVGHHIRVGDIAMGSGVEALGDPEAMVCTCVPPHVSREAEAETAAEAEAAPEQA